MPSSRGVFLTQGSNPGLPHCRWILYHLSHQGSPKCDIFIIYHNFNKIPRVFLETVYSWNDYFLKIRTSITPITLAYHFISSITHLPTPRSFPPGQHGTSVPPVTGTSFFNLHSSYKPHVAKSPSPKQNEPPAEAQICGYIHSYSSQDRRVPGERIITFTPRTLRGESTVDPPYQQVLHLWVQSTPDQNTCKKNYREFQKTKLEFAMHQQLFTQHLHCIHNHLHSICILLGIKSNLEMI